MRPLIFIAFFLSTSLSTFSQRQIKTSSDIQLELNRLGFLGNVLYLAAHPDDENTRMITWLENEKLARTAYLSLTRGDGGQNLIGTEKGAAMGILRTQELLEARKIDGGEQFFTRAVDFGYSKTADETLEIWDKQKILSDVVWVIRKFRPDIIITRFPPDGYGGHGHHTASAMLALEAFELAADKEAFPEQLKWVDVWQPTRVLWNASSWWDKDLDEKAKKSDDYIRIDIGEYNALLGESYSEIAAESRSQHKSQGFGASKVRGSEIEYLKHMAGKKAKGSLFADISTSWEKYPNGKEIQSKLKSLQSNYQPEEPSQSVEALLEIYKLIQSLEQTPETEYKLFELKKIIKACLGIYVEAVSKEPIAYLGKTVDGTFTIINRSKVPVQFTTTINDSTYSYKNLDFNKNINIDFTTPIFEKVSQPYWLHDDYFGVFKINDQQKIGMAENKAVFTVPYKLKIEGTTIEYEEPLQYKWTDRVDGENYRNISVEPIASIIISDPVFIFSDNTPKKISVVVDVNVQKMDATLKAIVPDGWQVQPKEAKIESLEKVSQQVFEFTVTPPTDAHTASIRFEVYKGSNSTSYSKQVIDYPHIKRQVFYPSASSKLVKLNIQTDAQNIGYIVGSGDEVPQGLEQIGYDVDIIQASTLGTTDLSIYDAILVGIRAYNTEEELIKGNVFLLEYVKNGGNLIVQYATNRDVLMKDIGPYPFTISRDRVTKEDAKVKFIDANNKVLNKPNKISEEDFNNWVQERGLYFAEDWDENYQPIFSWNDPGETEKEGALIIADYGKGHFMYTGISFFRQLPAGVSGAFRLIANMIEY